MPPGQFKFITDGVVGDVPNGFYPAADSDRGAILLGTPGSKELCQLPSCSEVREVSSWNNYLYALARRGSVSPLFRVDPTTGAYAEIGVIPTSFTGPAWMKNNPTQLGICDGVSLYVYTPTTGSLVQNTDPEFVGAGGFDYQDTYGFFFQPNTRSWFLTMPDDFTKVKSTDQYVKQTQPDNIIGLMSFMRQPLIMGADTGEWYHNTGGTDTSGGTATFERDPGGLMNFGLAAPKTLNNFNGSIPVWLSNLGQALMAVGYSPTPFSNQMFEREVRYKYPLYSDAIAYSYQDQGHSFYVITFPTGNTTWVFDQTTKLWHKRQSYLDDGSGWGRHRGNCYALLNNKHFIGDYSNGKIYQMSRNFYDDDGEEIQRILYTPNFDGGRKYLMHKYLQLLMKVGVGLESGLDPQVMLQISDDAGNIWSSELWQSAGPIGAYSTPVRWDQLGASYQRMYRLIFSDPVPWEIWGLDQKVG